MAETPVNRKAIRQAIADALGAPGVMPSALDIYPYMKAGFDGASPVVRVVNAGSNRPESTARGHRSQFFFSVQFFVIYYEEGTPAAQAAAEDTLDDLEHELISWMDGNHNTERWTTLKWADRSRTQVVREGGHQYILEDVPIVVDVVG